MPLAYCFLMQISASGEPTGDETIKLKRFWLPSVSAPETFLCSLVEAWKRNLSFRHGISSRGDWWRCRRGGGLVGGDGIKFFSARATRHVIKRTVFMSSRLGSHLGSFIECKRAGGSSMTPSGQCCLREGWCSHEICLLSLSREVTRLVGASSIYVMEKSWLWTLSAVTELYSCDKQIELNDSKRLRAGVCSVARSWITSHAWRCKCHNESL